MIKEIWKQLSASDTELLKASASFPDIRHPLHVHMEVSINYLFTTKILMYKSCISSDMICQYGHFKIIRLFNEVKAVTNWINSHTNLTRLGLTATQQLVQLWHCRTADQGHIWWNTEAFQQYFNNSCSSLILVCLTCCQDRHLVSQLPDWQKIKMVIQYKPFLVIIIRTAKHVHDTVSNSTGYMTNLDIPCFESTWVYVYLLFLFFFKPEAITNVDQGHSEISYVYLTTVNRAEMCYPSFF